MSTRKAKRAKALKEAAIDKAIIKLHTKLKSTIQDPQLLIVATAKIYAQTVLIQHQKNQTKSNVIPVSDVTGKA